MKNRQHHSVLKIDHDRGDRRFCFWVAAVALLLLMSASEFVVAQEREWSDSTGKFKVVGSLIEVKDGSVFLKNSQGKTIKIPVERLSAKDQEFLKGSENPFEVVEEKMEQSATPRNEPAGNSEPGTPSETPWSSEYSVDWDRVDLIDQGFGAEWTYQPTANQLDFEPKRAMLPGKLNFFEGMRRLIINPVARRAVTGHTVSFSVPKHLSRVSLIDLPSGKAINSDTVECNMCPLALLNDGNTILMQGTANERDGYETADQLQLWRIKGKKVIRSPSWIPFPDDSKSFGKTANGAISRCFPVADKLIVLLTNDGHLACFDVVSRQPVWHARLSGNHAIDLTVDQQNLFVVNEDQLMVLEPKSGVVTSSMKLNGSPRMGWTRIKLDSVGNQLLLSFVSELRTIDLATGVDQVVYQATGQGPISPNGLLFPDPDYALLNTNLLFHLPTSIMVCEYQQAAVIESIGGVEFVGIVGEKESLIVPTQIPHPKAESVLKQAENDPSVFLIHPGVEVSIDTGSVNGNYQAEIKDGLSAAAKQAGYKVVNNAPIRLRATISGPEQKAVSYIARGSYVATQYTSTLELLDGNKTVWSRSATNIPGMLQTGRDESIQDKLNELGKKPNIGFFGKVQLPTLMQAPVEGENQSSVNALLTSKFTTGGLEDSK